MSDKTRCILLCIFIEITILAGSTLAWIGIRNDKGWLVFMSAYMMFIGFEYLWYARDFIKEQLYESF